MSRTFKARNTNGVASVADGPPHTARVNTNQNLMAMATAETPTEEIPVADSSQNIKETRTTAQRKEEKMGMDEQGPT